MSYDPIAVWSTDDLKRYKMSAKFFNWSEFFGRDNRPIPHYDKHILDRYIIDNLRDCTFETITFTHTSTTQRKMKSPSLTMHSMMSQNYARLNAYTVCATLFIDSVVLTKHDNRRTQPYC